VPEPMNMAGWETRGDGYMRRVPDDRPAWRRLQQSLLSEADRWAPFAATSPVAAAHYRDLKAHAINLSTLSSDDSRLEALELASRFTTQQRRCCTTPPPSHAACAPRRRATDGAAKDMFGLASKYRRL
jgi:hypothetical protein